jgi:hypothetical protein
MRGSRRKVRWNNDRVRKKKDRDRRRTEAKAAAHRAEKAPHAKP